MQVHDLVALFLLTHGRDDGVAKDVRVLDSPEVPDWAIRVGWQVQSISPHRLNVSKQFPRHHGVDPALAVIGDEAAHPGTQFSLAPQMVVFLHEYEGVRAQCDIHRQGDD